MNKIILMLLIICCSNNLLAQNGTPGKLSFTVTGINAQPAENATATLLRNNKFFKAAVADTKGNILFEGLPTDTFVLKISAAGYEEKTSSIVISSSSPEVNLAAVSLSKKKSTELGL